MTTPTPEGGLSAEELGQMLLQAAYEANPGGEPMPAWKNCRPDAQEELRQTAKRFLELHNAALAEPISPPQPTVEEIEAIIAAQIGAMPYTNYSFVAQNDLVERSRATRYARSIARRVARQVASLHSRGGRGDLGLLGQPCADVGSDIPRSPEGGAS